MEDVHYVSIQKVGDIPISKGDFQSLPESVQTWLAQMVMKTTAIIRLVVD